MNAPTTLTVALSTLPIGQWLTISGYLGVFQIVEKRPTDTLMVQYTDSPTNFGTPFVRTGTTQVTPIATPRSMTIDWEVPVLLT